ncbi:MAG TPA: hypothetical protein VHO70_04130 [Chitinispirillaceae bacterium]|nr:hypothetical protein [Chitinispirillaceae bacterium]
MSGSVALDVVISLVFIYALYSLFTTTINEIRASACHRRAKILEIALRRMLMDDDEYSVLGKKLIEMFLNQPLVKYMNKGGRINRFPSYISKESFSKTIVDSLMECSGKSDQPVIPQAMYDGINALSVSESKSVLQGSPAELSAKNKSDTLRLIKSYLIDSNNDLQKFRLHLEQWFNDMMERTTGWYKRETQWWTLITGLFIAIAFNVDTIKIVDILSVDKSAREQITQLAINTAKNYPVDSFPDTVSHHVDSLVSYAVSLYNKDIQNSNKILALGWSCSSWKQFTKQWYFSLLGWIITALAISLGAPFWFDLLSKLVQLRGTGTKPPEKNTVAQTADDVSVLQRKG